jgi:hypothetical protein
VLVNVAAELAALVRSVAGSLVVVANNSLGYESGEVVIGVPANTLHGNSNIGSAHCVVTNANIRANEVGLLLGQEVCMVLRASALETREVLLS